MFQIGRGSPPPPPPVARASLAVVVVSCADEHVMPRQDNPWLRRRDRRQRSSADGTVAREIMRCVLMANWPWRAY
jgi:hypothetical protein